MRTNQAFSIAASIGVGLCLGASANIFDHEYTTDWFDAGIPSLEEGAVLVAPWTLPDDGSAAVETAGAVALDTEHEDPLDYATGTQSNVAAIVAKFTVMTNVEKPEFSDESPAPQAALTAYEEGASTNWIGWVGQAGGDPKWVAFANVTPVVGEEYETRIEFDNSDSAARKIRYLVNGTVLLEEGATSGWYPNPSGSANVATVSFSGVGSITSFAGENILEKVIIGLADGYGFDFTNGVVTLTTSSRQGGSAGLVVIGPDGKRTELGEKTIATGDQQNTWDLTGLTAGGFYSYEFQFKNPDGAVVDRQYGTFVAANWNADVWFGASAEAPDEPVNGQWDQVPAVQDDMFVISQDAARTFTVTDAEQGKGRVSRVDADVVVVELVDSTALASVDASPAFGGLVAVAVSGEPRWMGLTSGGWTALSGAVAPKAGRRYVIRTEVDFKVAPARIRYLVSSDGGKFFYPLSKDGSEWLPQSQDASLETLPAVKLMGSVKVANFGAKTSDAALALVNGIPYEALTDILPGSTIILRTNATFKPGRAGTWTFDKGAFDVRVDLSALPAGSTYSWSGNVLTVVADSSAAGATYLIW